VSSLKVICPKCFKGQQVVGGVPPGGADHVCVFCKTTFRVKPPARPSSDDLPVPRELLPKPGDLPAPREAVPKPGDLPVPREAVPRPGDLPVPREAVPKPGDLPVPREAVPKPGDLPVPREAVPKPGGLPAAQAPAPGRPIAHPARPPAKTPPLGLSLDLSIGSDIPAGGGPLSLDLPPIPPSPAKAPAPTVLSPPSAEKKPPPSPPKPPIPGRAAGIAPPAARTGTMPLPPLVPSQESPPAPSIPAPKREPTPAPVAPSRPLDSLDLDLGPAPATPLPARASGAGNAANAGGKGLDLGFSLELEGNAQTQPAAPAAIPFRAARVASEGMAEVAAGAAGDQLPTLAPPTAHGTSAGRALRPVARKRAVPKWIFFVAGGLVLAAAAAVIGLPLLRTAPSPDAVLGPFAAELGKDSLPAYHKGAERLTTVAASYGSARLRLRAAELLLTAQVAHGGGPENVSKAEQLIEGAAGQPKLAGALGRVQALLAIAKGRPKDADMQLADRGAIENQRILGMARLAEEKPTAAVDVLRRYLAGRPTDVLARYLLARALLVAAPTQARKEFEAVLAQNPGHVGAKVGLAKLEETAEKRLAAGRKLADQKLPDAGSLELAELQLLIGQAAQELGRTPEAIDAFKRAMTLDRRLVAALLSLGECLLYEGKYKEALDHLQAAGRGILATPAGKFNLGGAQIANGQVEQGLNLVNAAAKERPDDPRGPFWQGFAASVKKPPDATATEQGYRDAIKRDPKFLPASLKLAAFLQHQDQAEDSLAVLRAAEEAGAPPSVLQLAWGEALIVAKEPAKAQAVFEKALEADPKSMSARLGIASALEAQGKLDLAKAALENALKESPATLGVRERLGQVALKLGDKAEALSRYQEEIKAGHPTLTLRLAVAELALDLGKVELAQSEAKKVLDQAPRNAEAAYTMARVHEAHGEIGTALTEYKHATSWGSTPRIALAYGRLLGKVGKVNEALAAYANAVSLPEGRMERGRIIFRAGDLEGALADFQAAAKMKPSDSDALILQGLCFDKMGQAAKAEEAWRAALRVDPESPEPHYRLGRMELDRAKPSAAVDHFRKAATKVADKSPWRPDLYFQLAQAELLTGAKAAALADFKKYLDIAPRSAPARPEAAEQVARLGAKPGGKLELVGSKAGGKRR
jgi:tetratricopeptide (TPR) repeat protein